MCFSILIKKTSILCSEELSRQMVMFFLLLFTVFNLFLFEIRIGVAYFFGTGPVGIIHETILGLC